MRSSVPLRLLRQLVAAGGVSAAEASPSVTAAAVACTSTSSSSWLRTAGDSRRGLTTSPASGAAAAAAASKAAVTGDLPKVLAELDAAVSREGAGPKDVADAALALTYLQARGDRRLWGKLFEAAAAHKADFDAASLTAFLWAAHTAGVGHFKTLYELAGPAAKLLPSLSPAQLALVVEALGGAGVDDRDLFRAAGAAVAAKAGDMTASQLAKVLGGAAAAGVADGSLAKAVLGGLAGKAGAGASARDLAQVVFALSQMGRADGATLSQLSKALAGKLGGGEAPQDLLAALWGFASLNHKPDGALLSKGAAAIRGAVAELSAEQQIAAAWALGVLGGGDKEVFGALFGALGATLSAAPDAVPVPQLAALAEASVMAGDKAKLPEQVARYALAMHSVAADAAKERAGAAGRDFRAAVATATARALGARYKPEVAAGVKALAKRTPTGVAVDYAVDALKVAVVPVDVPGLSSSKPATPLGAAVAAGEVLRAAGYAPAFVPAPEFNALPDDASRARYVLAAIKAAAPGAAKEVAALERKLAEPFDPYA